MSKSTLQEKQEMLELCWKGTGDGMWDWDMRNDVVVFSNRWKEILGYKPDEISLISKGKNSRSFLIVKDNKKFLLKYFKDNDIIKRNRLLISI